MALEGYAFPLRTGAAKFPQLLTLAPVVSAELDALEAAGFVEESAHTLGATNEFGEMRRFDYKLGKGSDLFLSRHHADAARYQEALARINDGSISQNARLLSIAAKVHLILSHGEATSEEIRAQAKDLGWQLQVVSIGRVSGYLKRLESN